MSNFTLKLHDITHSTEFEGVASFVGEDASGSFGILARRARLMTYLSIGLSRFQVQGNAWQYIATPGALLYFRNNTLCLSTRRYFVDTDFTRISEKLEKHLTQEEMQLRGQKQSLRRMEEEVLKRLWTLGRV